jgi:hypothetical protein
MNKIINTVLHGLIKYEADLLKVPVRSFAETAKECYSVSERW